MDTIMFGRNSFNVTRLKSIARVGRGDGEGVGVRVGVAVGVGVSVTVGVRVLVGVDEGVNVGGMGVGAGAHPLVVTTSRVSTMNTKRTEVFIVFLLLIGLRQILATMFISQDLHLTFCEDIYVRTMADSTAFGSDSQQPMSLSESLVSKTQRTVSAPALNMELRNPAEPFGRLLM
jgi:hypothetical protein